MIPLQKVLLLKTPFLLVPVNPNPNPNFFSLVTLTLLWGGSVVQVHVKYATDEPAKAVVFTTGFVSITAAIIFVAFQRTNISIVLTLEYLRDLLAQKQRTSESSAMTIPINPWIRKGEV